jgi:hypothetical protein
MSRLIWSLAAALALAPSAAAQSDPASVKKTVEKGGEFWSSPAEVTVGETSVKPGTRLLFWPELDEVYDATRKRITVRFHWQLMPGEKAFKRDQALRLTILAPAQPEFSATAVVQPAAGEEKGMVSATLPLEKCECAGPTDLVLYLGLKEPQSNLVQLKVRFERLSKAPQKPLR